MADIETVVKDVQKEIKSFGDDVKGLKDSMERSLAEVRAKAEEAGTKAATSAEVKKDLEALASAVTEKHTALETMVKEIETKTKALGDASEEVERKLNKLRLQGSTALTQADQFKSYEGFARDMMFARNELKKGVVVDEKAVEARMAEIKEYEKHYASYVRWGGQDAGNQAIDMKSMLVGSDPDGGYWVTPAVSSRILKIVYESSPMRDLADVQSVSTDALEFPVDDGEFGAGWVGETEARPETTTSQTGVQRIVVHEMYANPKATQKLLDDAAVDVEAWIGNKIGEKFGRLEATAFVAGNGIKKPRGFLTYPNGTSRGQIEQQATAVAGAISFDDIINLMVKMKEAYVAGSVFLARRVTIGTLLLIKDGNGQYIWRPGVTAGAPSVMLGHNVYQAADMDAVQTNGLALAFGNFKQGYTIVDRLGVSTLRDPYTAKPFIQFYTRKRVGGDVTNFEAIKLLKVS